MRVRFTTDASVRGSGWSASWSCTSNPCVAGRGDQYIEHGGYTWRTLDGAAPEGGHYGAPGNGCQSNYLPLPAGWVLAPNDATSIAVVAAHTWSTYCAVLADGSSWYSANRGSPGDSCNWPNADSNMLATSGGTYTVTGCRRRVLARCG